MKTLQEITDNIITGVVLRKNMGDEQVMELLKEWGDSIVDECAGNFECTMEEMEDGEYEEAYTGKTLHPVLMRGSIMKVKSQIK